MTTPTPPAVPARVRTTAYYALLIVSAVTALGTGLAGIWWPAYAGQVIATGGVLTTVSGIIAGGLGVAYRPTHTTAEVTTGLALTEAERALIDDWRAVEAADLTDPGED